MAAGRLFHVPQPIEHRDAFDCRRMAAGPGDRQQSIGDAALVRKRKGAEKQERRSHVQRRRKPRRAFHRRSAAGRIHEIQPVVETNLFRRAYPLVKIRQVRAAAQGDVLAIVHFAAVGQRVGSGAPAQVGTLFQQADAEARFSQRDGGGHPRQTAADHQNALRGHPSSTNR